MSSALLQYPSGRASVVQNEDRSFTFFNDSDAHNVLAHFKLGEGFVCSPDGTPKLVLRASGASLYSPADADWTGPWKELTWPLASPLSLSINSYFTLTLTSRTDLSVKARSGDVFDCGLPSRPSYLQNAELDLASGRYAIKLDRLKHPQLVDRKYAVAKPKDGEDKLPRLSSSGREVAGFELSVKLNTVAKNHAQGKKLQDFTTDLGMKMDALKAQTKGFINKGPESVLANISSVRHVEKGTSGAESPPTRKKIFKSKRVPLKIMRGRKVGAFVSEIKSDQLCAILCSDLTSTDCRAADMVVREFMTKALNSALNGQDASTADVDELITKLPCQAIVADCLADKTLSKKYNFLTLPMFLFFFGGDLVYIGNRPRNLVLTLEVISLCVPPSSPFLYLP